MANIPAVLDGLDDNWQDCRQHHTGSVLGRLGAGDAHGHAVSACFRAGASLTPSPVMAAGARSPGPDDADLVLRDTRAYTLTLVRTPQFLAHGLNNAPPASVPGVEMPISLAMMAVTCGRH